MIKLIIVGAALVATAAVARNPQGSSRGDSNETTCRIISDTGSRLARSRICMTRAQWEEHRRNTRQDVDRSQLTRVEKQDH